MKFSELFIKKPVFCSVLAIFLIIFGLLSLKELPLRQFPDIERSEVSIDTLYPGASSVIVETVIIFSSKLFRVPKIEFNKS